MTFLSRIRCGNLNIIMDMKKILYIIAGVLLLVSCQHDVIYEVDYNVTLDPSNTYYAGEPVKFNFTGDVDNLLFYSGETGHQYKNRNRFEVPMEEVNAAKLTIQYQARYGYEDGLKVYVSNSFDGLTFDDAAADKAKVKAMVESGMAGWTELDYQEGKSTVWTSQEYDLSPYLSNVCLAFHWTPVRDGKSAQRTYWVNADITLDMEGTAPSTMSVSDLGPNVIMMNDQIENPYVKNNGNGTIILNKPATADIVFQGVGATVLDYGLDGWVFTTPSPLNKVANDKGIVVKNLQNYLHEYEYTWTEPGTYTVTFVGRNENYAAASEEVIEYTVTILEKPE